MSEISKPIVMVVDDQLNWREALADMLSQEFVVVTYANYSDAWHALTLQELVYSVVIADLRLEDQDPSNDEGLRLLENLRKVNEFTNTVMLTGYTTYESEIRAQQSKVFGYLLKDSRSVTSAFIHRMRELVRSAARDSNRKRAIYLCSRIREDLINHTTLDEHKILQSLYSCLELFLDTTDVYLSMVLSVESAMTYSGRTAEKVLETSKGRFWLLTVEHEKQFSKFKHHQSSSSDNSLIETIEATLQNGPLPAYIQSSNGRTDRPPNYVSPCRLGMPLVFAQNVLGVIIVHGHSISNQLAVGDMEVIETLVGEIASVIWTLWKYRDFDMRILKLKRTQENIVEREEVFTRNAIATDLIHRLNNLIGVIPFKVDDIKAHLDPNTADYVFVSNQLDEIANRADEVLEAVGWLKSPAVPRSINICTQLNQIARRILIEQPARFVVNVECEENIPSVEAVPNQLAFALYNVVQNGIDAMPEGGQILIRAQSTTDKGGPMVEIIVTDEGQGIAPDQINSVFRPFYTTKPTGMGYALWRSRNIIENYGGSMSISSKVNVGTTVTIRLPAIGGTINVES